MSETVNCIITFIDGKELKVAWERHEEAHHRAGGLIDRVLQAQSVALELDGYFDHRSSEQCSEYRGLPPPPALPNTVIKGARKV
jgi:hypothetical protein